MKMMVGLGNPGDKYTNNRHNIGFWLIDAVADGARFQSKFHGLFTKVNVAGESVVLLKPMTYMNESGRAVRAAMDFFKLSADDVFVVHDELDVTPLRVKIKQGGGEGGHNGLKSISKHLATPNYWRIRIGIGHPGDKSRVHGHVLSDFSKAEQPQFEQLCTDIIRELPLILKEESGKALSNLAL